MCFSIFCGSSPKRTTSQKLKDFAFANHPKCIFSFSLALLAKVSVLVKAFVFGFGFNVGFVLVLVSVLVLNFGFGFSRYRWLDLDFFYSSYFCLFVLTLSFFLSVCIFSSFSDKVSTAIKAAMHDGRQYGNRTVHGREPSTRESRR
jgi:hypothetical protein